VRKRRAALTCGALACGAMGLALATAGPATTGCTTHQCDQSSYDFVDGVLLDENTYVTSYMDSNWLPFPGNSTVRIWFPSQLLRRTPKVPAVEVGLDPTPNGGDAFRNGDNYIPGSGQLAILNCLSTAPTNPAAPGCPGTLYKSDGGSYGGELSVTNTTCANYFLRVEVDFVPVGPEADASGPLDGPGPIDAPAEAETASILPDSAVAATLVDSSEAGALTGTADAGPDSD
jgi:hypothetical protein